MPPNKRERPAQLSPQVKKAPAEPPQYPPLPPVQPGEVEGVEQLKRLLGMFKYDMQVSFESLQTYVINGVEDMKEKMDRLIRLVEGVGNQANRTSDAQREVAQRVEAAEGRLDELEDQLATGKPNGHG